MLLENDLKPQISVIIPVYNAEVYIEECLQSVIRQTLKGMEIICIDDGSLDNSVEIVQQMANEDDRIRLLQQTNQGAGKARNLGIQEARGNYVAFLDADDCYVDADALERMLCACESYGVRVCGSLRLREENGVRKREPLFDGLLGSGEETVLLSYGDVQLDYDYQSFLFRRELLVENSILFPSYRRFQDPPFFVRALHKAGKFVLLRTCLYCYRVPDMAGRMDAGRVKDLLLGLTDNLDYAWAHGLDLLFQRTLERMEYEYGNIIYHNILPGDADVLELLVKANDMIRRCLDAPGYVLEPLRRVLLGTDRDRTGYGDRLLERIGREERIAVYGAGRLAGKFLGYLEERGLLDRVACLVVSDEGENGTDMKGIPVKGVRAFAETGPMAVFVAVGAAHHKDVVRSLEENRIGVYELVDDVFLGRL